MKRHDRGALLLAGARAVLPGGVTDTAVDCVVEGGRIVELGSGIAPPARAQRVDVSGLWLLPGWIDIQLNDITWLGRGAQEPTAHAQRIREVAGYQAKHGVTGFVLATLAAPTEEILSYLAGMREVLEHPRAAFETAFLGALVEGTFMNPEFHGAHNPRWVVPPDRDLIDRFASSGAVRLINIAPETSRDAVELVSHATRSGLVVGCGHAKPHARRLREAVAAGLRYMIHLGNGPTGSSWKSFHDGGALEESLRNDEIVVSVIVDNYHVHPALLRDWIERKGTRRVVAVSDGGFATGLPTGDFEVFGIRGEVAEGGAYLRVKVAPDTTPANPYSSDVARLFGSAVVMRDVFENLLNLFSTEIVGVYHRCHAALSFSATVEEATRLCATNPARLLGEADRGELRVGHRADLVLARIAGNPGHYSVEIKDVYVAGERVSIA